MAAIFGAATILLFLALDWIIRRNVTRDMARWVRNIPSHDARPVPPRVPAGIFFTRSHTWLNLFPSGKVRLGLDDFVTSVLERAEVTLVKDLGAAVRRGEPLLVLSAEGRALPVRAPINGTILAANDALEGGKGIRRPDVFGDGWVYTIQPTDIEELRGFLLGDESRSWMAGETRRLRDFLVARSAQDWLVPAVLQDGGAPASAALLHLDPESWKQFEEQFLRAG